MNTDDFNSVKEWFRTHSRHSFQMENPINPLLNDGILFSELDWIKLNREVIDGVLNCLGDHADSWLYVLEDNDHIGVYNPHLNTKRAREIMENAENSVKTELRIEGYALLEVLDKASYEEELQGLQDRYSEDEILKNTGSGKLPGVVHQLHRTCGCWVPSYVVRGLHRNGAFLKPGTPCRDTVDLQLWRWEQLLGFGIDS